MGTCALALTRAVLTRRAGSAMKLEENRIQGLMRPCTVAWTAAAVLLRMLRAFITSLMW